MLLGEKIRKIRTFRGMTQKELGAAMGLGSRGSDNRITQYENNYRIPKQDILDQIAQILHVNPCNFQLNYTGCIEDFIFALFWMEEEFPNFIRLFQLERIPGKRTCDSDNSAKYDDGTNWPIYPPVGMYFNDGMLDNFMHEWLARRMNLEYGEITKEEYFEWKINWPLTSDNYGRCTPAIPWRKDK